MDMLEQLTSEFLTCHICFETYSQPKQLPCLHTFCFHCLYQYLKTHLTAQPRSRSLACPLCRVESVMPGKRRLSPREWAAYFPDNVMVKKLMEKVGGVREKEEEVPIVHEELEVEDTQADFRPSQCKNHNQPLLGFCLQHELLLCAECPELQDHQECIVLDTSERNSLEHVARNQLRQVSENLGTLQGNAEVIQDLLKERPAETRKRKEEVESFVSEHFTNLQKTIDDMLKNFRDAFQSKMNESIMDDASDVPELTVESEVCGTLLSSYQDELLASLDELLENDVVGALQQVQTSSERLRTMETWMSDLRQRVSHQHLDNITKEGMKKLLDTWSLQDLIKKTKHWPSKALPFEELLSSKSGQDIRSRQLPAKRTLSQWAERLQCLDSQELCVEKDGSFQHCLSSISAMEAIMMSDSMAALPASSQATVCKQQQEDEGEEEEEGGGDEDDTEPFPELTEENEMAEACAENVQEEEKHCDEESEEHIEEMNAAVRKMEEELRQFTVV